VTSVENGTTNAHLRTGTDAGNVAVARAALDVMLTDSAVSQGRPSRFLDPVAARERRPAVWASATRNCSVATHAWSCRRAVISKH
jgi:hypothetical protein